MSVIDKISEGFNSLFKSLNIPSPGSIRDNESPALRRIPVAMLGIEQNILIEKSFLFHISGYFGLWSFVFISFTK
jgi:hypothetical protein